MSEYSLNTVILESITNMNFKTVTDLKLDFYIYDFGEIVQFFDYLLYHVSKYDENLLREIQENKEINNLYISETELSVGIKLLKTLSMPKKSEIEQVFIQIYNKQQKYMDAMMSIIQHTDQCAFFIIHPKFPKECLYIINYKKKWLEFFNIENENKKVDISEVDFLILLSGPVYVFKSENLFQKIIEPVMQNNHLYILFYS